MLCPKCNTLNAQSRVRCRNCNASLFATDKNIPATDLATVKPSFDEPANTIPENNTLVPLDPVQPSLERTTQLLPEVHSKMDQEELLESESYVSNVDRTITFIKFSAWKKTLGFIVLGFLLVAAGYAGVDYLNDSTSQRSAQLLFAQGEEFYNEGNYFASLKIFQRFSDTFPQSELMPLAEARIDSLQSGLVSAQEQQIYLERRRELLLQKARAAFSNKYFVSPENDNVNIYVKELLNLDPNNHEAISMRDRLVGYLDGEGAQAMLAEDYQKAIDVFGNILKVLPDDEFALERKKQAELLFESRKTEEAQNDENNIAKAQRQVRKQNNGQAVSAKPNLVKKRPRKEATPVTAEPAPVSQPQTKGPSEPLANMAELDSQAPKVTPPPAPRKPPAYSGQASMELVSRWKSVTNYIASNVDVIKQTKTRLVLYHTKHKEFLTLSLKKSSHTDLYAAVEQYDDKEPQLVWVTHRDLLNAPNRAKRAIEFFKPEFKTKLRPPKG